MSGCSADQTGPPTLTWYINPDDGGQAEIAQRCTQASGGRYAISASLLPRDASSQREQLARRLAAGDNSMDIMSLDPPFVPELAEPGFLAPVPQDVIDKTTTDVVDGARNAAGADTSFVWVDPAFVRALGEIHETWFPMWHPHQPGFHAYDAATGSLLWSVRLGTLVAPMVRAFAWKPRSAMIMLLNSAARSTLERSSLPSSSCGLEPPIS